MAIAIAVIGCERTSGEPVRRGDAPDATSPVTCAPQISEKLGVSFVRVCPSRARGAPPGVELAPFWISVVPIACAAGDHDTVRCPPVVALAQPAADEPLAIRPAVSQLAAVVESDTAHKICTMRFAGRLPTRTERAIVRASLGLSTVLVMDSAEIGGVRTRELAEWVTEKACDHPTTLAPDCGPNGFPWEASAIIPWDLALHCEPRPLAVLVGRPLIGVDGECPLPADARGRELACVLRGPAADPRARSTAGVALTCDRAAPAPRNASSPKLDAAAFRCVLPEWL
jgi:hypothetical protein